MSVNIAVLVSGGGTNLQALIDARLTNGKIALVVSNREGAYALKRAENAGIPAMTIAKKREAFEAELIEALKAAKIDMIILAGFMSILSAEFTTRYDKRIINVHPALIPAFCGKGFYGLKVHQAALERGVKLTGATVHYVNEIPDGGEIIFQKAVAVEPNDTPETLQLRVMREAEWVILPAAAELVAKRISEEKNA